MRDTQRIALCSTMALMGCALIAVMWSSQDTAALVHEETPAVILPEAEFLESPKKAAATAPKVLYPADHDLGVWSGYTSIKREAKKKLAPAEFVGIEKQCMATRRESAKTCAQLYCAAHATCGEPCPKLYASPPMQVIPLQPGGPHFHKVAEVEHKEQHNKELKAKEGAAKERAAKEHAEKAKEKAAKEVDFKERVGKEKSAKEKTMKAAAKKEQATKQSIQAELVTKEGEVKKKVAELKGSNVAVCQAQAGTYLHHCEEQKVKEAAAKEKAAKQLALKEMSTKMEAKLAEHREKEIKYGTGPYTAGQGSGFGSGFGSGGMHFPGSGPAEHFTGGPSMPGGVATVPTAYGETESKCAVLKAVDCITTLGCHLDIDQNKCVEGVGEAVAGSHATPLAPASTLPDPIAIATTCDDDETWEDDSGTTCGDVTSAFCSANGNTTFPGFGCASSGSDCKTANEACCMCKIVEAGASTCVDKAAWSNSRVGSCASIKDEAPDWCANYGEEITPGSGCKLDGSNCLSANEACCACQKSATPETGSTTPALPVVPPVAAGSAPMGIGGAM